MQDPQVREVYLGGGMTTAVRPRGRDRPQAAPAGE
ncbi:hypothetical protein ACFQU7_26595 [Pseudoroseomonas wenyumeiae]